MEKITDIQMGHTASNEDEPFYLKIRTPSAQLEMYASEKQIERIADSSERMLAEMKVGQNRNNGTR